MDFLKALKANLKKALDKIIPVGVAQVP